MHRPWENTSVFMRSIDAIARESFNSSETGADVYEVHLTSYGSYNSVSEMSSAVVLI
jgi:hypothetical protein